MVIIDFPFHLAADSHVVCSVIAEPLGHVVEPQSPTQYVALQLPSFASACLVQRGTIETDSSSSSSSVDDSETDDEKSISDVRELFQKARLLLCPTTFYRQVTYLYAERKLTVFFLVHLVSTLLVET